MGRSLKTRKPAPTDPFERLIQAFERLPGVGRRSAERMAYHLLNDTQDGAMALALAIRDVKKSYHPCVVCGNLTEQERCAVCRDPQRDPSVLIVVEWPRDVRAIEKTASFRGQYHVLMGRLSPLSGVEPDDLRLNALMKRVKNGVAELILATGPTVEGDATANHIRTLALKSNPRLKITRLARGLPAGSELSVSQSGTIGEAIRGRREFA